MTRTVTLPRTKREEPVLNATNVTVVLTAVVSWLLGDGEVAGVVDAVTLVLPTLAVAALGYGLRLFSGVFSPATVSEIETRALDSALDVLVEAQGADAARAELEAAIGRYNDRKSQGL